MDSHAGNLTYAPGRETGAEILPLGPPAVDAAWVGEILVFGLAAAFVFLKYRDRYLNLET